MKVTLSPAVVRLRIGPAGDVSGPPSSTDGAVAQFTGTTGRRLRAGPVIGNIGALILGLSALPLGALLVGAGVAAPTALPIGGAGTILASDGTAPAWRALVAGDLPAHSHAAASITGLATVATSGAYADLSGRPTLATVATSGAYADLSGRPTLATVATSGAYADLSGRPTLATVATSGSASDLGAGTLAVARGGTGANGSALAQGLVLASPAGTSGAATYRALAASDMAALLGTANAWTAQQTVAAAIRVNNAYGMIVGSDGGYIGVGAYWSGSSWNRVTANQGGAIIRNTGGQFEIWTGAAATAAVDTAIAGFGRKAYLSGDGHFGIDVGSLCLGVAPTAGAGSIQIAIGTTQANAILYGDTAVYRYGAGALHHVAPTGADAVYRIARSTGEQAIIACVNGAGWFGMQSVHPLALTINSITRLLISTAGRVSLEVATDPTAGPTYAASYLHLGAASNATVGGIRAITAGYTSGATNVPCAFGYQQTSIAGFTQGRFFVAVRTNTLDSAPTTYFSVEPGGSVVTGQNDVTALADGHLYIPRSAGAPTGTPTNQNGRVALCFDITNNRLYAYNSNTLAWKQVTLA